MKRDTPFTVTEWDWLKLQLEMYSIEHRSEMYSVLFNFQSDKQGRIICMIYGKHADTMVENKAAKKEQLEYYKSWVRVEKQQIKKALKALPVLRREFNVDKDVVFRIMHHYGMGWSVICEFVEKKIEWKKQ